MLQLKNLRFIFLFAIGILCWLAFPQRQALAQIQCNDIVTEPATLESTNFSVLQNCVGEKQYYYLIKGKIKGAITSLSAKSMTPVGTEEFLQQTDEEFLTFQSACGTSGTFDEGFYIYPGTNSNGFSDFVFKVGIM